MDSSQTLITLDFEVYKYDWLAGFKIYHTGEYFQFHNDREGLMEFIDTYKDAIYFTMNGYHYDDNILQAIIDNKDPFVVSQDIIVRKQDPLAWNLPIVTYDLQFPGRGAKLSNMPSLKIFESNVGMSIEELPIAPDFKTKLTPEQLEILKEYNKHDLDATEVCLTQRFYESFMVKVHLITYFGLDFRRWIGRTMQGILCEGLGAKKGKFPHQAFSWEGKFSNLQIANPRIRQWLEEEEFYEYPLEIDICGVPHILAKGGIHGALPNFYQATDLWHVDFASFYPSLMIEYDLMSRSLEGNGGRDKFIKLRADRLEAKKNKDVKDAALKVAINSVFGASDNEYLPLNDPSRSRLVCMYGQAYTIDLLEKLEPYIFLIQSNTDGIIFELKDKSEAGVAQMHGILDEFRSRTGLGMDAEKYEYIAQRDVNNYMAIFEGKPELKGNTASSQLTPDKAYYRGNYRVFQTTVVSRALAQRILYMKPIAETIREEFEAGNWFRFQATSKTGKQFHKVCIHESDTSVGEQLTMINLMLKDKDVKDLLKEHGITRLTSYAVFYKRYCMDEFTEDQLDLLEALGIVPLNEDDRVIEVQHINRVFASNDKNVKRVLKKYKYNAAGKESAGLVTNLPDNVFIFNKALSEFGEEDKSKLDLQWYIDAAYRETYVYMTGDKKTKNMDIIKPLVDAFENGRNL